MCAMTLELQQASGMHARAECCNVLQCVVMCWQCVTQCRSVLLCVAACCSVLTRSYVVNDAFIRATLLIHVHGRMHAQGRPDTRIRATRPMTHSNESVHTYESIPGCRTRHGQCQWWP